MSRRAKGRPPRREPGGGLGFLSGPTAGQAMPPWGYRDRGAVSRSQSSLLSLVR